jgi:N-methylhydantoinase B
MWMRTVGGSEVTALSESETRLEMHKGDQLITLRCGGGGWGPAFERDADAVQADVWDEYYTPSAARELFGVVLRGDERVIDAGATEMLRNQRVRDDPPPGTAAALVCGA